MPRKAPAITIKELKSKPELDSLFPLIRQLNPKMGKRQFNQSLKEMLAYGYRCAGAYHGKKLVGACGIWSGTRFWCGQYMEVDNVVVDQDQRSGGIGKLLMQWVEKEAARAKCKLVIADSYTHNVASHRFYFREGYIIKGFCFVKELY